MTLLLGIDEAGYGPLLGPLVVSGAAIDLPDAHMSADLWETLRLSVARTPKSAAGRVVINDSKALHKKSAKSNLLQRGVLAALYAVDSSLPQTVGQWLHSTHFQSLDQFNEYPWYRSALLDRPLDYPTDDIQIAGTSLQNDSRQHQIAWISLTACPVPVGQYNRAIQQTHNKATVLFNTACQIIYQTWTSHPQHSLQIVLDKQGGRSHYRGHLQKMFPELTMKILKETSTVSSYQLSSPHRLMKVHFVQKGDQKNLLTALASMISKYTRELFMDALNDYFIQQHPSLKKTAGYYQDGSRFLKDLDQAHLLSQQPRHLLIRDK